jgi:hypothetical protein
MSAIIATLTVTKVLYIIGAFGVLNILLGRFGRGIS